MQDTATPAGPSAAEVIGRGACWHAEGAGTPVATLGAFNFRLREVRYAPFPWVARQPLALAGEPDAWVIEDEDGCYLLIDHRARAGDDERVCRVEFWECTVPGEVPLDGLFAVADAAPRGGAGEP